MPVEDTMIGMDVGTIVIAGADLTPVFASCRLSRTATTLDVSGPKDWFEHHRTTKIGQGLDVTTDVRTAEELLLLVGQQISFTAQLTGRTVTGLGILQEVVPEAPGDGKQQVTHRIVPCGEWTWV